MRWGTCPKKQGGRTKEAKMAMKAVRMARKSGAGGIRGANARVRRLGP
jgi:hypothetical protein